MKLKKCRICGQEFMPRSCRQVDCNRDVEKTCIICGNSFIGKCSKNDSNLTCSAECKNKYASNQRKSSYASNHTATCVLCGKQFAPVSNTQVVCNDSHYRNCVICGKSFELFRDKNTRVADLPNTCSKECANKLRFKNGNPFSRPEYRQKAIDTMRMKYGEDFYRKILDKGQKTYKTKTGYEHWSLNPEVRSRQAKARMFSGLEKKVASLLENYHIEYIHQYFLSNAKGGHTFDFYLPKYKILVDADGSYFHSYMSDPDGKQVLDAYDAIRLDLVPDDHIFHLIVESNVNKDFKRLIDTLAKIDEGLFDFDSDMFNWCRSIEFPYPEYTKTRMIADYSSLCRYQNNTYTPNAKLGYSIISNYHKWLFHCHVGDTLSPVEGWYDDNTLKKVIKNRFIYVNEVQPAKILTGLYISKLAPRVSIFNPVLAKYLTLKYLDEFHTVFDPFSGFSGRLLGVCAAGKCYIGQDLNNIVVDEAIQIIRDFELCATVSNNDILKSSGEYECILTCPPYGKKEIYNNESEFKSCDEWIDEVVSRFQCKRYVFVVDKTEKYVNNIVESLNLKSHLNSVTEHVIVIEG